MLRENPSSKSGFNYYFRNNKKTLYIKKPRARKYEKFSVPRGVKADKFLESMIREMALGSYFDFKFYYTKKGEITTKKQEADTLWVKLPKGRKFNKIPFGRKLSAAKADEFTRFVIQEIQKEQRSKKAKKDEKKSVTNRREAISDLSEGALEDVKYTFYYTEGFYKSDTYKITKFEGVVADPIPIIKITKNNIEDFLDYMENFGMVFCQSMLTDLGIKTGQTFRIRIRGGGDYKRQIKARGGRVKKVVTDSFGFSLPRFKYSTKNFPDFVDLFMATLRDKFIGKNSYLARSVNGVLYFEGFNVEIYSKK